MNASPIVFKAATRSPDTTRRENNRRVTKPVDHARLPKHIPWVLMDNPEDAGGKQVLLPTIVEVRATVMDVHADTKGSKNELWTSWNVWAGPRHPLLLQKLREPKMLRECDVLHARLTELGARKGGWWQINYCPRGRDGNNTPFVEIMSSAMSPGGMTYENIRQTTPEWNQRMVWNPVRRFFGRPEVYPPAWLHTHKLWGKENPEVHERVRCALEEFAEDFVDRLWTAWAMNDADINMNLMNQDVRVGAQTPTRMGRLSGTQMGEEASHSLYFER